MEVPVLGEFEVFEVRDRQFLTPRVSELSQRDLPSMDPFSALDTCTRLILAAGSRYSITCKSKLEAIFLKVMDKVYDHKGGNSQTLINLVDCVRPPLSRSAG